MADGVFGPGLGSLPTHSRAVGSAFCPWWPPCDPCTSKDIESHLPNAGSRRRPKAGRVVATFDLDVFISEYLHGCSFEQN